MARVCDMCTVWIRQGFMERAGMAGVLHSGGRHHMTKPCQKARGNPRHHPYCMYVDVGGGGSVGGGG